MLCDAIERNDLGEIRRLVENGEDIDQIDFEHETSPIEKAAEERNAEALKLLLELGADTNRAMISPALLIAASNGDDEIVGVLLSSGANPDEMNEDEITPLMGAAQKGHKAIVETLLARGADPHRKTREGVTAYAEASSSEIRALLPPE